MRIAFDQQVFLLQEFGGISRYICGLASHLAELPGVEARIFAPLHYNSHLADLPANLALARRVPKIPKTFRAVEFVSRSVAQLSARLYGPQIIHETYYSPAGFRPKGAKCVLTVYDMIHERFAGSFDRANVTTEAKRAAAHRADHVICISENTRRDLVELFGIPEEKTSVVYLGYGPNVGAGDAELGVARERPYLLYVGPRGAYKNFQAVLAAYGASTALRDYQLVCCGGGPLSAKEREAMARYGLAEDQVVQVNGDDAMLAALYRHAAVFVYPSLYEGFGIPPLEAMAQGCPVVVSNTSSLPEVVGDAGEYFDPASSDGLAAALERVLCSPDRRRDLIERGLQRCALFTWQHCAEETLAIYRSLL